MKQIEAKAKTVHEAIEDACTQLGVSQDEATIEILEHGGMFKKARVLVTVKEDFAKPAPVVEEKPVEAKPIVESAKKQQATKSEAKRTPSPSTATDKEISSGVSHMSPKFEKTFSFVTKLLELLDNDSTITTEINDKSFDINITGEHIGILIGKNGVSLNAIQTIVTSIAISNSTGEGKRVIVNVGDYREKRGDTLQAIAMKKAEWVKKTGRYAKLDPMSARDRAIIHTTLATVEGIKTYSTGRDPFRCLCIAPADKE